MISGIVLLILAGICWVAIGIAVSRCAATGLNYNIVQMISSAGAALISVPVLFLSGGRPELPGKILLAVFLLHFGAGVANYFNYVLTARAMRLGHNGIVWGMMQSGLLAPFLMGVLFFNVPLPLGRVLGIAAILCGILLLGVTRDPGAGRRSSSRARWLIPAFGAFLLAGVTQCCNSLPSYWKIAADSGSVFRTFSCMTGNAVGFLICLEFDPALRRSPRSAEWKIGLLLLLLFCLSNYFFFYNGLNLVAEAGAGSIGYPIPIGVCIVGCTVYCAVHRKERFPLAGWIGLIAVTLGIIGISLR